MVNTDIDLTKFIGKGATLDVIFNAPAKPDPYLIFITDDKGDIMYYYRKINSPKVSINLPEHSPSVKLYSPFTVTQILTRPLRVTKVNYVYKTNQVQKRNYPIEQIVDQVIPFIPEQKNIGGRLVMVPSDQPARFLPSKGIRQFSEKVMPTMPQPVRIFIYYHEEGHYPYGRSVEDLLTPDQKPFYNLYPDQIWTILSQPQKDRFLRERMEDEIEADRYALYKVLNEGYNLSGTLYALTDFLSDNYISRERIKALYIEAEKIDRNFHQ